MEIFSENQKIVLIFLFLFFVIRFGVKIAVGMPHGIFFTQIEALHGKSVFTSPTAHCVL